MIHPGIAAGQNVNVISFEAQLIDRDIGRYLNAALRRNPAQGASDFYDSAFSVLAFAIRITGIVPDVAVSPAFQDEHVSERGIIEEMKIQSGGSAQQEQRRCFRCARRGSRVCTAEWQAYFLRNIRESGRFPF